MPLLNKPSPNVKEVIPTAENQNQKLADCKTQNIAQKMFPVNKPNAIQKDSSKDI